VNINKVNEEFLQEAIGRIKKAFPNTIAAYDGFAIPRMTADSRIEVFLLREDEIQEFLHLAGTLVVELGWDNDWDFKILGWTIAESKEYFPEDIAKLQTSSANTKQSNSSLVVSYGPAWTIAPQNCHCSQFSLTPATWKTPTIAEPANLGLPLAA
jgi:hypothetical protein